MVSEIRFSKELGREIRVSLDLRVMHSGFSAKRESAQGKKHQNPTRIGHAKSAATTIKEVTPFDQKTEANPFFVEIKV